MGYALLTDHTSYSAECDYHISWEFTLLVGILSDTHNELTRTKEAVEVLHSSGAEMLIHCGDLAIPEIVEICSALPFYFVFGNHDSDMVPDLRAAAQEFHATCLDWGGDGNC